MTVRSKAVSSEAAEVEMKQATSGGSPDPKLVALRAEMKAAGIDAFVVPSQDPHFSEYVPTCFERRMYVSGFTGSAGTALITSDAALLWTDGRYFLQAEQELGAEWTLMRGGQPGVPEPKAWITGGGSHHHRWGGVFIFLCLIFFKIFICYLLNFATPPPSPPSHFTYPSTFIAV